MFHQLSQEKCHAQDEVVSSTFVNTRSTRIITIKWFPHASKVEFTLMTHNCRSASLHLCGRVGSPRDIPGMSGYDRKHSRTLENPEMTRPRMTPFVVATGLLLGLSACTNPYDPVQRMIGGGLIGAGSGAAIGAAAAGGHGAALGAAVGGAVGAVGGLITTPPLPAHYGYYNH